MSKHELTVNKDYVPDWSYVEGVREIFQNALDQEISDSNNKMYFNYNEDTETFIVGNKHSMLEVSDLLLGSTTKKDDDGTIGQFGEGLDLAIIIFLRENIKLTVNNYGKKEVWKPRYVKSRIYNQNMPTVFVEKRSWNKPPNNDLEFILEGITSEMYDNIVDSNLHLMGELKTKNSPNYGRLLEDEHLRGKIFVNGLFVMEEDNLDYGYDFLPQLLKLKRDRSMVSEYNLKTMMSDLLKNAEGFGKSEIAKMVLNESEDVSYLNYTSQSYEYGKEAYKAFKEINGENSIPISRKTNIDSFIEDYPEAKLVSVSTDTFDLLSKADNYDEDVKKLHVEKDRVLSEKMEKWFIGVSEDRYFLSKEKNDFDDLVRQVRKIEKTIDMVESEVVDE